MRREGWVIKGFAVSNKIMHHFIFYDSISIWKPENKQIYKVPIILLDIYSSANEYKSVFVFLLSFKNKNTLYV